MRRCSVTGHTAIIFPTQVRPEVSAVSSVLQSSSPFLLLWARGSDQAQRNHSVEVMSRPLVSLCSNLNIFTETLFWRPLIFGSTGASSLLCPTIRISWRKIRVLLMARTGTTGATTRRKWGPARRKVFLTTRIFVRSATSTGETAPAGQPAELNRFWGLILSCNKIYYTWI